MSKARSQFSAGFFGCAGYQIVDNNCFNSIEEAIRLSLESEADIIVICSSDEEYLLFAPAIYENLKENSIIVVAGNPSSINELKSKGLEIFIHISSDLIETLKYFNKRLGITR
jgi:methylmalonyl-CoA mutase